MEWLLWLVVSAVTVIPMWRLCERDGLNPAWSLACILPVGLIILLWVLAFRNADGVA
jgi:hypothetical protein